MHSSMHKAKAVFALVPENSVELMELKRRLLECPAGEFRHEVGEAMRGAIRLDKLDIVRTLLPLMDCCEAAELFQLAAELGRPDCLVHLRPYFAGTLYDSLRQLHDRCAAGQSAAGRRVCLSLVQYWVANEKTTIAAAPTISASAVLAPAVAAPAISASAVVAPTVAAPTVSASAVLVPAAAAPATSCVELLERRAGELDVTGALEGIHGHL